MPRTATAKLERRNEILQMVRWILARRDSWGICDKCNLEPDFFAGTGIFHLERAQPLLSSPVVPGVARDVPGHRRVDLRCLRASCRPLRAHLRIREAAGRTGSPQGEEQNMVVKSCGENFSRKINSCFFKSFFNVFQNHS